MAKRRWWNKRLKIEKLLSGGYICRIYSSPRFSLEWFVDGFRHHTGISGYDRGLEIRLVGLVLFRIWVFPRFWDLTILGFSFCGEKGDK